jgi:hypothetical protein
MWQPEREKRTLALDRKNQIEFFIASITGGGLRESKA